MLHPHELASFFSLCSVIVLQSSNKPGLTARTYNFGLYIRVINPYSIVYHSHKNPLSCITSLPRRFHVH